MKFKLKLTARFLARMKEKRTETPEQRAKRIADYEMAMQMLENF